jgi:hypothetical protein
LPGLFRSDRGSSRICSAERIGNFSLPMCLSKLLAIEPTSSGVVVVDLRLVAAVVAAVAY